MGIIELQGRRKRKCCLFIRGTKLKVGQKVNFCCKNTPIELKNTKLLLKFSVLVLGCVPKFYFLFKTFQMHFALIKSAKCRIEKNKDCGLHKTRNYELSSTFKLVLTCKTKMAEFFLRILLPKRFWQSYIKCKNAIE